MEKLQLLQSVTELVLDVEKRFPEDRIIDINYMGAVNGFRITLMNSEYETVDSRIHYFGFTYGDSIEEITEWLGTLS
jgi:hypothetical protein